MGSLINEILKYLQDTGSYEFVSIWNNQFDYIDEGESYSFPMPCAFIELNNEFSQPIGGRYMGNDLVLNIHIGQDFYNSDLLEQNNNIFDLRNKLIQSLSTFKPTNTSLLVQTGEQQDYQHTNVYHYIVSYKLHWIDDTAVQPNYETTPPINLIING
jgi:hypothetical protein